MLITNPKPSHQVSKQGTKCKPTVVIITVTCRERGVGAMIACKESEYDRLTADNLATISGYGENFMEVICRDAADGHDVGRVSGKFVYK